MAPCAINWPLGSAIHWPSGQKISSTYHIKFEYISLDFTTLTLHYCCMACCVPWSFCVLIAEPQKLAAHCTLMCFSGSKSMCWVIQLSRYCLKNHVEQSIFQQSNCKKNEKWYYFPTCLKHFLHHLSCESLDQSIVLACSLNRPKQQ